MRHQIGADHVIGIDHRGQRHHLAVGRARVELGNVFRLLAVCRIGLQHHVPDPAVLRELADHDRAELRLQRAVDIRDRHAEQHRLRAVDGRPHLLRNAAISRRHAPKLGALVGFRQELLGDFVQPARIAAHPVLDPELETAAGADAGNRRRRDRKEHAGVDVLRSGVDVAQNGTDVFLLRGLDRFITLLEVLEGHEHCRDVGLVLAVDETVAVDDRAVGDRRILREQRVDPLDVSIVRFMLAASGMMICAKV